MCCIKKFVKKIDKESVQMKVVIVGGVAAGMSTAARLRRLNESANIVVIERSQYVSFANCGLPYHIGNEIKDRNQLVLQTPQSLAESLNLDVRVQHEVIKIDVAAKTVEIKNLANNQVYSESYDKLVLCPGAKPIRPQLPGIEHAKILSLRNIEDMDKIKSMLTDAVNNITVIGGGYIGVEMAENLAHLGKKVTLIERGNQIISPLDKEMTKDLERSLEAHGVELKFNTEVEGFLDLNGQLSVSVKNADAISSDLVILAIGVRPDITLLKDTPIAVGERGGIQVNPQMQTSVPDVYAAGDAVEVLDAITKQSALIPLAGPANRQGRIVADNIAGRNGRYQSTYQATQGTAIIKVFDMTGAGTGASEKTLLRANMLYRKIYLHPSGHAGYYPGTKPMHMKVLFSPNDGKLLGAQVVGYDGVDKRIDVLATAIKAGMTVYDLEHLELAYAPPYGSAKDPINMAGFVGVNLLEGEIDFWYAEDFETLRQDALMIDVRGEAEFKKGHIPDAINIPLKELRSRLNTLPKDKPILLNCLVGLRSYLAQRVLLQNGYAKVKTLAGGYKTFVNYLG